MWLHRDTIIKPLKRRHPKKAFVQAGRRIRVVIMLTTTTGCKWHLPKSKLSIVDADDCSYMDLEKWTVKTTAAIE